ncbi:MAG TPA: glycosyltransferase family 4 protein [Tepidisphaeraceae bacterium]|jgi:glycosyltransferase involved in cell wall biosynthesis|nr:glycosyltransferase family 4 protein [Tepidisphaeraceae bacterium]
MSSDAINSDVFEDAFDRRQVGDARADDAQGRPASREGKIIVATINRPTGDTGVHTHTAALLDGLAAASQPCGMQGPFSRAPWWLAVFGARRIFGPFNRSWGTRWYRHWHGAALASNLKHALRRQGAAAILAQCPVSASAALKVRAKLGLNCPIAMVCHFNFSEAREYREKGELHDRASYRAMLDFERAVMGAVDHVVYVSRWARRVVEEERRIVTRGSSVIWNGIAAASPAAVARETIGLKPSDLAIINVGSLEPRKNQFGLLDLFLRVSRYHANARLILVGEGPDRQRLRQRIAELRLDDRVMLLGLRRDVPALLATSDLYVHYAAMENCPLALIEAARAALPIAGAPGGGAAELLSALGGVTLDPADVATSCNALLPLLNDLSVRRRFGDAGRAAFDRSFTREAMIGAYIKTLDGIQRRPAEALP